MRTSSCYTLLPATAALLLAGCATISAPLPAAPPPAPIAVPAAPAQQLSYVEQLRDALEAQLAMAMQQGEVEIEAPQAHELTVTIPTDASFSADSARLRPAAQAMLAQIATLLRRFNHTALTIAGYSDQTGNPAQAQQLSAARARQVMQYLATQGIATARMQAAGYGEQNPRASNHTEFGRALNRRILITLAPAIAG